MPVALGAAWAGPSVALFIAVFAISGLVAAAQDSLESAMAADLVPAHTRGTAFGVLATVNAVGDLVSSVWVGLVWSRISPAFAFVIAGALALAGTAAMTGIAIRHRTG